MAAPKKDKAGVRDHYRYLNGKMVMPLMFMPGKRMGGQVDDKPILDENGNPIRYQSIGISARKHLSNVK
jgi:hypothetical protein